VIGALVDEKHDGSARRHSNMLYVNAAIDPHLRRDQFV
jgi:hypothetical protein